MHLNRKHSTMHKKLNKLMNMHTFLLLWDTTCIQIYSRNAISTDFVVAWLSKKISYQHWVSLKITPHNKTVNEFHQIVLPVFSHNCNIIWAMEMIILLGWYVNKALYIDEWASIIQMFYTLRAWLYSLDNRNTTVFNIHLLIVVYVS